MIALSAGWAIKNNLDLIEKCVVSSARHVKHFAFRYICLLDKQVVSSVFFTADALAVDYCRVHWHDVYRGRGKIDFRGNVKIIIYDLV